MRETIKVQEPSCDVLKMFFRPMKLLQVVLVLHGMKYNQEPWPSTKGTFLFVCLKITQKPYYGTVGTDCLIKLSDYVVTTTLKASDTNRIAGSFLVKNGLWRPVLFCT